MPSRKKSNKKKPKFPTQGKPKSAPQAASSNKQRSKPIVTDKKLYKWASEIYDESTLDEDAVQALRGGSNIYHQQCFKDIFADMKQSGKDGTEFNRWGVLRIDRNGEECVAYVSDVDEAREEYRRLGLGDDIPLMTMFHTFVVTTDFVLVDAMIRLGANIDIRTTDGETSLSLACQELHMARNKRETNGQILPHLRRRIIQRLLEVGMDPNAGRTPPLHSACAAADLLTCELLLQNGADPDVKAGGIKAIDLLPGKLTKKFRKLKRGHRPEPKCWCLSGKLLEECHNPEDGGALDPSFGCPCGSGKRFGKCCQRAGIVFGETRDEVVRTVELPLHTTKVAESLQRIVNNRTEDGDIWRPTTEQATAFWKTRVSLLSTQEFGPFDPAFAHAMNIADFQPIYWVHVVPENERIIRKNEWNDAVDSYIALGTDNRPALEIERFAKIGASGGRLYGVCTTCNAQEEYPEEFLSCAGCQIHSYCSKDCQKVHWKTNGHREACGKEKHNLDENPLHLPSQLTVLKAVSDGWVPSMH